MDAVMRSAALDNEYRGAEWRLYKIGLCRVTALVPSEGSGKFSP
jgi:hypothetical protein